MNRSIEFQPEPQHNIKDESEFSPRSSESSKGLSTSRSKIVKPNLFTPSPISSPLLKRESLGTTKKRTSTEEDVWPELGDDLLPL